MASQEIRARDRQHSRESTISAKKLADLLEEMHLEERFLLQRLRDQELSLVRDTLDAASDTAVSNTDTPEQSTVSEEPEADEPVVTETYKEFAA